MYNILKYTYVLLFDDKIKVLRTIENVLGFQSLLLFCWRHLHVKLDFTPKGYFQPICHQTSPSASNDEKLYYKNSSCQQCIVSTYLASYIGNVIKNIIYSINTDKKFDNTQNWRSHLALKVFKVPYNSVIYCNVFLCYIFKLIPTMKVILVIIIPITVISSMSIYV